LIRSQGKNKKEKDGMSDEFTTNENGSKTPEETNFQPGQAASAGE